MMKIDLNADLGESFGNYTIGNDEAIIPIQIRYKNNFTSDDTSNSITSK